MSGLNPEKLHVKFQAGGAEPGTPLPRAYTLTHSDQTGELFLTIGPTYDQAQISGWYTRLMRDEILAEWREGESGLELHVTCHVSGGVVIGGAGWRYQIFQGHMRQVLEALRYGDRQLFNQIPELEQAPILVHFTARQKKYNREEVWGVCGDYRLEDH